MTSFNVVITGVSRGLGRALTEELASLGHTVYGCGRNAAAMAELSAKLPSPHTFSKVDISLDKGVSQWSLQVLSHFESLDFLILCAGLANKPASLWDVPTKEFDNIIDVNIKGTANCLRHFLPTMVLKKHGTVVIFSSGLGKTTSPEFAPYCASKWAIEGLSQSVSQEVPRGVTVVALNPGMINTDMLKSGFSDSDKFPTPEKWAKKAVPFILEIGSEQNGLSLNVPKCSEDIPDLPLTLKGLPLSVKTKN